ncbi:hypothetical protein QV08_10365 [Gallibacterium salpingitidis]|uniref:hypothetical protein n=1 Tax=Gallibacterium salpingitidis TaxID=505341 RepID=UPI00080528F8|nr:hypothetical protein [Gallibacterium salpingitidis]OBX06379.1 hypothetical protein QV08_10365 [Gallibacterium salpingitidis]
MGDKRVNGINFPIYELGKLNITPEHNILEFIGFSLHKVAKFYSLTQDAFSAQVKAKTIDMGEINEEAEDKIENLSAKLVDKNTIIVDSKRYYRCP